MANFIQDVKIKCNTQELMDSIRATENQFNFSISQTDHKTRLDKTILELDFDGCTLLMKKENDIFTIEPFTLKSRNYYSEVNASLDCFLYNLSKKNKGDYLVYYNGQTTFVKKGILIESSLVVGAKKEKTYIDLDNPYASAYKIKTNIVTYLKDNPDIKDAIKGKKQSEGFNYIAADILNKKIKEDIPFELFLDVYRQCITFGADDPKLLKLNEILKL